MELNSDNKEKLKKSAEEYAKKTGIKTNPNKKVFDSIANSLIKRKEKFKEIYCPCRVIQGNEKDKEIICPCVFHRGEIELQGHCKCNFFVG